MQAPLLQNPSLWTSNRNGIHFSFTNSVTNFLFHISSFLFPSHNRFFKYFAVEFYSRKCVIISWNRERYQVRVAVTVDNTNCRDQHLVCIKNCAMWRHNSVQSVEKNHEIRKSCDSSKFILKKTSKTPGNKPYLQFFFLVNWLGLPLRLSTHVCSTHDSAHTRHIRLLFFRPDALTAETL